MSMLTVRVRAAALTTVFLATACASTQETGASSTPGDEGSGDRSAPSASEQAPSDTAEKAPRGPAAGRSQEPAVPPVARVNGVDIDGAAFAAELERVRGRFASAGRELGEPLERRVTGNLLRKAVEEELLRQRAAAEGIVVDPADLERRVAEHRARFGDDAQVKAFLERTNQSEGEFRDELAFRLLRERLIDARLGDGRPTRADAKAYFEANKSRFDERESVRASHILFKVADDESEEAHKAARDKAEMVTALARKPGADFAALAREHSEGPTRARGGDLGKFSRGRMVMEFEQAAFGAKVGEVVGPVKTRFGYHVVKVFEKTPGGPRAFDDIADVIIRSLNTQAEQRAQDALIEDLYGTADIEIFLPDVTLRRGTPAGGKR